MSQTRTSLRLIGLALVSLFLAVPAFATVTLPPDDLTVNSIERESADLAEAIAKSRTLVMSPAERTLVLASVATASPKKKSNDKDARPVVRTRAN
jgi:hypothetical protein